MLHAERARPLFAGSESNCCEPACGWRWAVMHNFPNEWLIAGGWINVVALWTKPSSPLDVDGTLQQPAFTAPTAAASLCLRSYYFRFKPAPHGLERTHRGWSGGAQACRLKWQKIKNKNSATLRMLLFRLKTTSWLYSIWRESAAFKLPVSSTVKVKINFMIEIRVMRT